MVTWIIHLDEHLFDGTAIDEMFNDAVISREEMRELLAPSVDRWQDVPVTQFQTKFTIDKAKTSQWEEARKEIQFIIGQVSKLVHSNQINPPRPTKSEVIL